MPNCLYIGSDLGGNEGSVLGSKEASDLGRLLVKVVPKPKDM